MTATDTADPGIEPVGRKTSLSGSTDRLDRDLVYGERITVVLDVIVTSVGLAKSSNGPIVERKLTAVDLYELEGSRGRDVIAALQAERRQNADAGTGAQVLPGFDVNTDAAGVVLTPGDKADLTERTDHVDDELAIARALVDGSLPFLRAEELSDETVIERLDGISLMTPRLVRAAIDVEMDGSMRDAVLAALDERLGVELERIRTEEPWDGYAKAKSVAVVVDRLMTDREMLEERGQWLDMVEHVGAFEQAHKGRAGIADFLAGETR